MQPTQELVDSIYREKVIRARRTPPPEEKLFAGSDAYEFAKSVTMAGIAHQNPGINGRTGPAGICLAACAMQAGREKRAAIKGIGGRE